jgi:hypothetical protein
VDGPGLLDWHLYRQGPRAILHCINLTNEGTWRGPLDELIPVGPIRARLKLPEGVRGDRIRLLVSDRRTTVKRENGWARFELASVVDHEVMVID